MKSFKIRKKIYKNKKYTKRKNIKTKKANTRRKKYNKKTFNKKSFNKKTFRKKSYNKKTLRKKSYRKTFNKKKFRNLKGGVRFWKKSVPSYEVPPSEVPPSQVSSPGVVTFVHNGPYTPDNTLLHVEPITWSRSFSMSNKKTRELPPGYLRTNKPDKYEKMKQLIDELRKTTLSKKELIKKRDNYEKKIFKYKQGIASENSYLDYNYPNYNNEVQNSIDKIDKYNMLINNSLNDIKRIDLAIQKIKDEESRNNHKLHTEFKDMYEEFKYENNVDA